MTGPQASPSPPDRASGAIALAMGQVRAAVAARAGGRGGRGPLPGRWTDRPRRGVRLGAALLALLWAGPAVSDDSDQCLTAAQDASRLSGVPLSVLLAITLTETGRGSEGAMRPWPWTVNMEGEGYWFDTREEALAFAEERRRQGAESFDIGCFQLNWRWHGENFVSLEQMFDPLANATYAASFLRRLAEETGDWSAAAGAFHSRTPELAAQYRARFDSFREAVVAAGADQGRLDGPLALAGTRLADAAPEGALLARVNSFPLLQNSGGTPRLGSLVPLGGG